MSDDDGAFNYASGSAPGTIDVPSNGRLKRISVVAGATAATITIRGGTAITVPANATFDEEIPGNAPGADVVIGGGVAAYYVSWVA